MFRRLRELVSTGKNCEMKKRGRGSQISVFLREHLSLSLTYLWCDAFSWELISVIYSSTVLLYRLEVSACSWVYSFYATIKLHLYLHVVFLIDLIPLHFLTAAVISNVYELAVPPERHLTSHLSSVVFTRYHLKHKYEQHIMKNDCVCYMQPDTKDCA